MAMRPRVQRREGRRVSLYEEEPHFEQTRYDLRSGGRHELDEHEEERERGFRAKARRPSPRVGWRQARSPSPVYSTGGLRERPRRREDTSTRRPAARAPPPRPLEDYVVHPLDDFDRYMLARRERPAKRRREHIRPAAREMERIAYMGGRRGREEEGEGEGYYNSGDFSEDTDEYDRFREMRRGRRMGDYDEHRGRQMTRRADLVARRRGRQDEGGEEEEEEEEKEKDYDYYPGQQEEEEEVESDEGYSDEGEGLVSAPEELDEDEEYITGRRMPIRSRRPRHEYDEGEGRQPLKRRRGGDEEEVGHGEEEEEGLEFTVDERGYGHGRTTRSRGRKRMHEEEEEEPKGRRDRRLPARKTHRHPTYEDMIAEALVKVGKNGKASGVAIFKYIHDHFDMPANDRLVRNHLHQAFERLIDDGKLRHKKASYVLPRNLLSEYDSKYGEKKEQKEGQEGEMGEGEQGAQKEGAEGESSEVQPSKKKAKTDESTTDQAEKATAEGSQQEEKSGETKPQEGDQKEGEQVSTPTKKGHAGGRKKSR